MSGSERLPIVGSTLALSPQTPGFSRSVRDGGPALWRRDLHRMQRAGFSRIDIVDTWLSVADLTAAELDDLRALADELGIRIDGVCVTRHSVLDPESGADNVAHGIRAASAAAALGAGTVSVGLSPVLTAAQRRATFWRVPGSEDRDDAETRALAARRLQRICDGAADSGVLVALEIYEGTLTQTGRGTVDLLDRTDRPNLRVNADLGNLYRVPWRLPESWYETFTAVLPHLGLWHLKNYARHEAHPDGPFTAHATSLGEGDIDYRLAIGTAIRAGFDGPLVLEQYGGDALHAQSQGAAYLSGLRADLLADIAEEQEEEGGR